MPNLSFTEIISGFLQLGPRTALAALRNTGLKKKLDREFQESLPEKRLAQVGKLLDTEVQPCGIRMRFEGASLEVAFLESNMVRVSWGPGDEPVPYTLAKQDWSGETVRVEECAAGWKLNGSLMEVEIYGEGTLSWRDAAGIELRHEEPPVRYGEGWKQKVRLPDSTAVYGLGERNGDLNKRGRSYRMWNGQPGMRYETSHDPLYICVPACLMVDSDQNSVQSSLVYYENYAPGYFDLDSKGEGWAEISFETGMLRYYLIFDSPARCLERFTELTGRAPLPPRWAFGYHQSRWGYKTDEDIRRVAQRFEQYHIPLSAIHLDIDYMDGFRVFTVNEGRFPNLRKLADDMAAKDVRLVAIVDPAVKKDPRYEVYRSGLENKAFCTLPNGEVYHGVVWPGWAAFPDFTSPEVRRWWGGWYRRLADWGIAGIWHDMNEPASFASDLNVDMTLPLSVHHSLENAVEDQSGGEDHRGQNHREANHPGGNHLQAHNLYGLLMDRAGFEAWQKLHPDKRPWILSRSGWAGLQRYAWNWTGDIEASWSLLRQTIPTILNLGLSGIPFNGPDAGGYHDNPSPELYIRWMQLSAFLPLFRGHSAKGFTAREPWNFGKQALKIVRETIRLRSRLMLYLYTAAWQTSQSGCPMVRPLFWEDPADTALRNAGDAFMLGDRLLVAPVVHEGALKREVRLPAGEWCSFWDGKAYSGPAIVELDAPIDRIPVLVRSGSLLPMEADDKLELHAFGSKPWEGVLYSDEGDGYGAWRVDKFKLLIKGDFPIQTHEGDFPFPYSQITVVHHPSA